MDYIRQVVVRNGDATGIRFLFEDRILTNFIYTEIGTDETLKKLLIDILDETIDGPIGFSGNENQCEITKEKVIITDELKLFYYRGISNWGKINGFLTDTCLTAQDHYKALLDYFRIKY